MRAKGEGKMTQFDLLFGAASAMVVLRTLQVKTSGRLNGNTAGKDNKSTDSGDLLCTVS